MKDKKNIKITIIMNREKAKHFSDVLKAYSEGKTIQYKFYDNIGKLYVWKDLTELITMDFSYGEYRVKPEPKYRPYKSAEEFLKDQKEHGPHLHNSYGYIIPIAVYDDKVVCPDRNGHEISFAVLKDGYTWQDGTQTGVLGE